MRRVLIPMLTAAVMALAPGLASAASSDIVRFTTPVGNIDVQLLPQDAPNTVANFLSYVNSAAYASTFFHRSQSGFVIQGGGYYVANGQIDQITQGAQVANEYGVPNTAGTLAMATPANQPDGATDEWFFNTVDNSSTLGPGGSSNSKGYTVFGKVLDPASLNVMNAIAALPIADESVSLGPDFKTLPYLGQSPTIANLVMSPITVLSPAAAPTIAITQPANGAQFVRGQTVTPQFTCGQGSGTAVQTCSGPTVIDTSDIGQHSFSVVATNYAGNTSTQTVHYTVVAAPKPKPEPKPKPTAPTLKGSLTTPSSGHLVLKLSCTSTTKCSGKITLYALGVAKHGKKTLLASGRYSIAAHKQGKLSLHLGHTAILLLRRHHSGLKVSLLLAPAGGKTHTVSTRLALRRG